jgi:UDP-2,3-diacylglucosamine pyrophosphatase LpxH
VAASYRTIWISDVHLGTPASRATDLSNFLAEVRADRIYLLGDIIDLKAMKLRPMFPGTHMGVIAALLQIVNRGTEVIYVPGNHDREIRSLAGRDICGVPVMLEALHETPSGRKLLVTHGDVLDARIRSGTSLERFGAAAYALLLRADVLFNKIRNGMGQEHLPISAAIKRRIRSANMYIERFETVAAEYACERAFDGIVCGHIHRPCLRRIGDTLYANDGDWVENRTALAEAADGTLQLLCWQYGRIGVESPGPIATLAA